MYIKKDSIQGNIVFPILILLLFVSSFSGFGQNIKSKSTDLSKEVPEGQVIYGCITDKVTHEPLVGATVRYAKIRKVMVVDKEGRFCLPAPIQPDELIVSFLGYETKRIKVYPRRALINVALTESTESLSEVIVTGYSTIKKNRFTGNTTKIDKQELLKANPTNLLAAIESFDPSFRLQENITQGSNPNALPSFVMRGQTGVGETELSKEKSSIISEESLTGNSNLPIFILDGFEVDVSKIYDLDINTIHSINLLKDAAATAMYGSRAANGVVVIERRAPEAGKFNVQYSGTYTIDIPDLSSYNLMNAREKLEAEKLAGLYGFPYGRGYYQRLNNRLVGVDTYWLSQGLHKALSHRHSLFINGGENDLRWGLELGYRDVNGVMKNTSRTNASAAIFIDYRLGGLQIKNKTSYTYNVSHALPFNNFSDYSHLQPYLRLYDNQHHYIRHLENFEGYTGTAINPLYEMNFYKSFDRGTYNEITHDIGLNWRITNHWRVRGRLSMLLRYTNNDKFIDPASSYFLGRSSERSGEETRQQLKNVSLDANLSLIYNRTLGDHAINMNVSTNMIQHHRESSFMKLVGFPGGDLTSPNYAAFIDNKPVILDNKTRLLGFLLLGNYSYKNIYLADFTARWDGSSEFGSNRRWSAFWSSGLGVNLHNLEFIKKYKNISSLRLRGSYGITGKTNFSLFAAQDMYSLENNQWYPTGYGVYLYQMGNPNLKWERKHTLDYGIDCGLWKDRLRFKVSLYREKTVDLITDYTIPSSTGFKSYKENMGKVLNQGVECEMSYQIVNTPKWLVQVYANFSHNRNTILEISQAMAEYNKRVEEVFKHYDPNTSTDRKYAKSYLKYYNGASLTSIYGMKSLGISPSNGKEIFLKRNGDITEQWSADEWQVIGNTAPTGQGGFGCTIAYDRFSLYTSFLYTFGADAYNNTLVQYVENADLRRDNADRRVLYDRWKKPGDVTTMKDIKNRNITTGATSRFVQKNNTLQLTSLTFSYKLSSRLLKICHIAQCKLSLSLNNLLYLSTIRQERGLDYPYARSFNLSTNITF